MDRTAQPYVVPDAIAPLVVLAGLGLLLGYSWALSWLILNPDHARALMVRGWHGLVALVCRPDAGEK
jgi:hypothetical protein